MSLIHWFDFRRTSLSHKQNSFLSKCYADSGLYIFAENGVPSSALKRFYNGNLSAYSRAKVAGLTPQEWEDISTKMEERIERVDEEEAERIQMQTHNGTRQGMEPSSRAPRLISTETNLDVQGSRRSDHSYTMERLRSPSPTSDYILHLHAVT